MTHTFLPENGLPIMSFRGKSFACLLLLLTALLLTAGAVLAVPIADPANRHNLSSLASHGGPKAAAPTSGGTDQICIFCHTPHSATPESTLWSRPDPNTAVFPLYAQPLVIKGDYPGSPAGSQDRSQYKNDGSVTYPNGASRLCLSCHDGATAIGILSDGSSIAMAGGADFVTGTAVIDLSTSHPISFVYDGAVRDDINAARGAGSYRLPDPADAVDTPLDGQSRMQCTTCHDPHDDASGFGVPPFWRQTSTVFLNPYDDVCNACHIAAPAGVPPLHDLP
ncbi:MAG: hypothetical protein RQ723_05020 [Desulfuromonadales bacterium]|nr:hypothetical protein [Desulfuromonadales bacterium]